MNDEELPPIEADDGDSPWSLEHGQEAAYIEPGTGPSCDDPAGNEARLSSSDGDSPGDDSDSDPSYPEPSGIETEAGSPGGGPVGDEGIDPDPPQSDRAAARPDDPVVRRRQRKGRKPPFGRHVHRQGTKKPMWHETLQVEMPPTLNFLSLGIGFGMGCGFCFFLMALGLIPGSRLVRDPKAAPGHYPEQQLDRLGADHAVPAEAPTSEVGQPGIDNATRDEPSETVPASNADEVRSSPLGRRYQSIAKYAEFWLVIEMQGFHDED